MIRGSGTFDCGSEVVLVEISPADDCVEEAVLLLYTGSLVPGRIEKDSELEEERRTWLWEIQMLVLM